MQVSVVVATLGESPLLARCLGEIRRQCDALAAELLVVVNAAPERLPADRAAALHDLAHRVLFEERPGKSFALNRGVTAARGAILAFTDDDAYPAPGWLAALVDPLHGGDPRLAGTGGRVTPVYPEGGPPPWYRRLAARHPSFFLGPCHDLGPEPCDYAAGGYVVPFGANCAFRRAALGEAPYPVELGPSRATGLRGGEDTVVALRLLQAGLRLRWTPESTVYHPVEPERMSRSYVERGYFLQGREQVRMARLLGRPLPSRARLQGKLARQIARAGLAALLRRRKRERLEMRVHFFRGMLVELQGAAAR